MFSVAALLGMQFVRFAQSAETQHTLQHLHTGIAAGCLSLAAARTPPPWSSSSPGEKVWKGLKVNTTSPSSMSYEVKLAKAAQASGPLSFLLNDFVLKDFRVNTTQL